MVRWTATGSVARILGGYVTASARDLLRPRSRAGPEPRGTPPTVDDLDQAGAEWEPLSTDPAEAYEATYDNGYVVVRRADDPYGPVWTVDEDVWETFLTGDDTPIEGL